MKELKKKYIKPYACVHECAYEEGLLAGTQITGSGPNPEGTGGNDEFTSRESGSLNFYGEELDDDI